MQNVVIAGASLAGLRAAEALRRRGYAGQLTLVGAEPELPYDRPPLSKQVLTGEWEPGRVFFRQKEGYDGLALTPRLGERAVSLDARARKLSLSGGDVLDYDGLVIATGAAAFKPAIPGVELPGVHVLRTLSDALAIRAACAAQPRVVVIGAGFIGLEVAASCRKLGLSVSVIEAAERPLARVFGAQVSAAISELHRAHGVELHTSLTASALEGAGRVERVRCSDGRVIAAELVVIGIGVTPETGWLEGSGVTLGNGVVCDARCATNVPGVVAAGDVASWPSALFGETLRIEHWTNAVEQGQLAAATLLGVEAAPTPFGQVPYFWSDQYDVKLQFAGRARPDDELVVIDGALSERAHVALFGREGILCGVLAQNRPALMIRYRKLIAERASFQAALAAASRG